MTIPTTHVRMSAPIISIPSRKCVTDAHRAFVRMGMQIVERTGASPVHDSYDAYPAILAFQDMWRDRSSRGRSLSISLLFWLRSPRTGIGLRAAFRRIVVWLATEADDGQPWLKEVLSVVPEVGRWDDLEVLFGTPMEKDAARLWAAAIVSGNQLACKWAKQNMVPLQRAIRGNEAKLRKLLVRGRGVTLETLMCAGRWSDIRYEDVSSGQLWFYRRAFMRHDGSRFEKFLADKRAGRNVFHAVAAGPEPTVLNRDRWHIALQVLPADVRAELGVPAASDAHADLAPPKDDEPVSQPQKAPTTVPGSDADSGDTQEDAQMAKAWVEKKLAESGRKNPMIGSSDAITRIYPLIFDFVHFPRQHVLLYGETGSGKEVLVDILQALDEPGRPFHVVQLQPVTDNSNVSAIFGHTEHAFSKIEVKRDGAIKTACGGTLVLDNLQYARREDFPLFLRVLEPKQEYQQIGSDKIECANCRIVAVFNIRPEEMVKNGKLPPDWIDRFGIRIDMPGLNDRREDIPMLVESFVEDSRHSNPSLSDFPKRDLMPDSHTMELWSKQDWSKVGNLRTLLNAAVDCGKPILRRRVLANTGQHGGENLGKQGKKAGRPPVRDIGDEDLCGILRQVVENPSLWTAKKLFEQINKRIRQRPNTPAKQMKESRDCLLSRIRRIKPEVLSREMQMTGTAEELRAKIHTALWDVRGYRELQK